MRRLLLAAVAVAAIAGGCGQEGRLDPDAARAMHRDVDRVRAAVAAGDRAAGLRALDALERRVSRAHEAGRLADAAATGLQERIDAARRRLRREVAEPEPTPEPTPESTPEPAAPAPTGGEGDEEKQDEDTGKKHEKGEGKGKAKGKEGGE
jgi:hypothetical protein